MKAAPASPKPLSKLISDWVCALRIPYFITTLIPPLMAFVLVGRETGIWPGSEFIALLLGILFMHAATNLINDYYDTINGVDNQKSVGGSRVVLDGKLTLADLARAATICYFLSLLAFLVFFWQTGRWWVMPGWFLGFMASFFYVGPPIAYGYKGWGEFFVFLSAGWLLLLGSFVALSGYFSIAALGTATLFGLMSADVLFYQSLPQIENDPLHGKNTLASKLGRRTALRVQKIIWPFIWLGCAAMFFSGLLAWPALGALLGIPFYFRLERRIAATIDSDLTGLYSAGYLVRIMFFIASLALMAGCLIMSEQTLF